MLNPCARESKARGRFLREKLIYDDCLFFLSTMANEERRTGKILGALSREAQGFERGLAVGRGQQSKSIELALTME